ncbi:MAG: hypothetical protein ACK595_03140, partial [Planctomycetota bacterium]
AGALPVGLPVGLRVGRPVGLPAPNNVRRRRFCDRRRRESPEHSPRAHRGAALSVDPSEAQRDQATRAAGPDA